MSTPEVVEAGQLHMLTTSDNPWSPITNWTEWQAWDEAAGYHTAAYLARVARSSDGLSQADWDLSIERAIDEIISENITGNYVKVPFNVTKTVL